MQVPASNLHPNSLHRLIRYGWTEVDEELSPGIAEACPALTTPPRFRHRPYAFDMSSVVPLRSSSCQSPDLVLPRPFPSVLTTMAFDHSRRRWFGTCSCQPVPRGLPSSIKQLHTLGPPRPFALVAHNHRHSAPA